MRLRSVAGQRAAVACMLLLCAVGCCALSARNLAAQTITDTLHARKVPSRGTVRGTVSLPTGAPAVHARIEATATHDTTFADTLGSFSLSSLPEGTSTLRVTRSDLNPLTIRIIVPADGILRVDVVLSQPVKVAPAKLSPVRVLSAIAPTPNTSIRTPAHLPGIWEWTGNIQDAPETSGEPDAFRLLASDPQEMMRADGFGGTAVNAASGSLADRAFVDGLPMWNAIHGMGALAAIDPEVVSSIKVSDGSASARSGDALFETVEFQTRESTVARPAFGAGFGPTTLRAWWADPVRIGAIDGQLLVAARRNSDAMTSSTVDANSVSDRWADGLTVLSLHHGASDVQLVAVASGDRLAADVDDATVGAASDAGSVAGPDQALTVPWQSLTVGGVWTDLLSPSRKLVTRAWDATFAISANPGVPNGDARMYNSARDWGLASELDVASLAMGASIEKIHTSYNVDVPSDGSSENGRPEGTETDSMPPTPGTSQYHAMADPAVLSAYVERHWGSIAGNWFATSGVHVTSLSAQAPYIEPRLSISVGLGDGVSMTAGYAGTHQFVQALRDISLTPAAIVPVSLPIAAGSAGVPVAAARTFMATLSKQLGLHTRVTVDAYDRRFDGLVVTNAAGTPLASGNVFDVLKGRMLGFGSAAQSTIGSLSVHLTYSSQRAILTQSSGSYFPSHEIAQMASTAVAWRARPTTTLRLVGSVGSSLLGTLSAADADGSGASRREEDAVPEPRLLGSSAFITGPIPAYMRVDVGLSHEWRAVGTGRFALTATLANLFNRSNVVALRPADARTQHLYALTPRSLMLGIGWRQ